MNRDELLTRLVLGLGEWPAVHNNFPPTSMMPAGSSWERSPVADTWHARATRGDITIDRHEWLAGRERLMNGSDTLTTSLGASGWDEDRIDIIGSNGNDGLAYSAPAWNGEGLPPVGANCLMQSHILGMWANEWLEVEVLAHKPPLMIGWCEEKQIAIWSDACRPIRTKEDEAVEHMKSVAGTSYVRPEYMEMITRALYRAGYRKMEAADE